MLIIAREPTVLEHIQSLHQQCAVESMITTSDEAVRRLESVEVSAVVIGGGVPEPSRPQIYAVAARHGVPVVAGALRGRDPATMSARNCYRPCGAPWPNRTRTNSLGASRETVHCRALSSNPRSVFLSGSALEAGAALWC